MGVAMLLGLGATMESKKHTLPRAMVLVYQPELTHSVWLDYRNTSRSIQGLERKLKEGVRRGDWVGWRLVRIEKEVIGNE